MFGKEVAVCGGARGSGHGIPKPRFSVGVPCRPKLSRIHIREGGGDLVDNVFGDARLPVKAAPTSVVAGDGIFASLSCCKNR
jgi:hypothetical protein